MKPFSKSKTAFLSKLAISLCNFELIKAEGLPEGEGAEGIEFGAAVNGEGAFMGEGVFKVRVTAGMFPAKGRERVLGKG